MKNDHRPPPTSQPGLVHLVKTYKLVLTIVGKFDPFTWLLVKCSIFQNHINIAKTEL